MSRVKSEQALRYFGEGTEQNSYTFSSQNKESVISRPQPPSKIKRRKSQAPSAATCPTTLSKNAINRALIIQELNKSKQKNQQDKEKEKKTINCDIQDQSVKIFQSKFRTSAEALTISRNSPTHQAIRIQNLLTMSPESSKQAPEYIQRPREVVRPATSTKLKAAAGSSLNVKIRKLKQIDPAPSRSRNE